MMLSNSRSPRKSAKGRTVHTLRGLQFGPPPVQPTTVQTAQPVENPPTPKPQATGGGEDSKLPTAA